MTRALKSRVFLPREDGTSFRSFIQFPLFIFRLVCIDFEVLSEYSTRKEKLLYYGRKAFVTLYFVCHWLAIASFATLTIISDDIVSVSRASMNTAASLFIVTKCFVAVFKKSAFRDLFQELENLFDHHDGNRRLAVKGHVESNNRLMRIFAVSFFALAIVIVLPIIPYLVNGSMILTVDYWYPFDQFQPRNYPFAYAWVLWTTWNDDFIFLGGEIMFHALVGAIAMELEFLKMDFATAFDASDNDGRAKEIENLIERHNQLFDLVDKLQEIYSSNILSSFVVSSIIIGFAAFQLSTTANDIATFSFYGPGMSMILAHIFALCVSGQKLIDKSEEVADGVYDCGWEKIDDESLKKQLILIMLRAQKAKKLSAMKFVNVSLETFTTVSFFQDIVLSSYLTFLFSVVNGDLFLSVVVTKSLFEIINLISDDVMLYRF